MTKNDLAAELPGLPTNYYWRIHGPRHAGYVWVFIRKPVLGIFHRTILTGLSLSGPSDILDVAEDLIVLFDERMLASNYNGTYKTGENK